MLVCFLAGELEPGNKATFGIHKSKCTGYGNRTGYKSID